MGDVDETRSWEFALDGPALDEGPPSAFQIGDGHLVILSDDRPLTSQFRRLYGDCTIATALARGPAVNCTIEIIDDEAHVRLCASEPSDLVTFLESAFQDRGCRYLSTDADGWHHMQSELPSLTFRVRDDCVAFPLSSPWRHLAANLMVGSVLRQQRAVIFMHAAGVGIGPDRRGVIFVGAKTAGKTTTSLGLASRGHLFFGDELVGIRTSSWELVAVRRTVAKREGPCDSMIATRLTRIAPERRRYADGHWRQMIVPGQVFGATPSPTRLHAVVLLDGFGETPALQPVSASLHTASRLTPVATTLWGESPTARVFALFKLLASVPCYSLRLGPPDDTSLLLEATFSK